MISITYRTDELSLWGLGKGSDLTPTEVDMNFWNLQSAIAAIQDHLTSAVVSLHYISQPAPDQILFHFTNGATEGPFTIPTSQWDFRGAWLATTTYAPNDVITFNASAYLVLYPHVSGGSFDPNANDGLGHNYYGLLFTVPGSVIPLGGAEGYVLTKASATDLAMIWAPPLLAKLFDVAFTSTIDDFSSMRFDTGSGKWINERYIAEQQLLQCTSQTVTSSGGTLTIDRDLGEICTLTMTENISDIIVNNWATSGFNGKIVLLVINPSTYTLSGWPSGTVSVALPTVTANGIDRYVLSTDDGGSTIFLDTIGQNYT